MEYGEGEGRITTGKEHIFPSTEILIATLNEEEGIGPTINDLSKNVQAQRVLVIDGRSIDRTIEIAKDLGAEILLQDGIGKGDAIAKALRCLPSHVDYVVLTDADYTYPAMYVPDMVKILEENSEVGMVCGNRFTEETEKSTFRSSFYYGNKFLALAHSLLNGVNLKDPLTGLRVIRANLLRSWTVKSKGFDIEVELNRHVERTGYKTVEMPIKYRPRLGEKKLKVRHGATILRRILLEIV